MKVEINQLYCKLSLALHEALGTELRGGLTDHNARACIVCHPDALSSNGVDSHDEYQVMDNVSLQLSQPCPVTEWTVTMNTKWWTT